MANTSTEPPTRIPPKASGFAASLFAKSVAERVQLLLNPSEETAADFIRAGIESSDAADLRRFVENDMDMIPIVKEWMELDNAMVRPLAQTTIRIWWPQIFAAAMNPRQILEDIRYHDPEKAAVLDSPKGRIWFNATIFNLLTFFRGYAKIEGDGQIVPPPNMPERLKRKALRGAVSVMRKVQGRS